MRLLLVLLLIIASNIAVAQRSNWKLIACTVDQSDSLKGAVLTFYFDEAGLVQLNAKQYQAKVTAAEISFCHDSEQKMKVCYNISRVSGRFHVYSPGTTYSHVAGSCVRGDVQKF